jgi:hypothetical protein
MLSSQWWSQRLELSETKGSEVELLQSRRDIEEEGG